MTLAWIRYAGGIEKRDDGWTIYHDPRYTQLRSPEGVLTKYRTETEAKRAADLKDKDVIPVQ